MKMKTHSVYIRMMSLLLAVLCIVGLFPASALAGIPVKGSVAMTGEITLRGRVLPIGGLREKLLAAVRAGMTAVIIPEENRKDLEDVPEEIKKALELHFASNAMTVMEKALAYMPKHSGRIRVEQRESGVSAVQ